MVAQKRTPSCASRKVTEKKISNKSANSRNKKTKDEDSKKQEPLPTKKPRARRTNVQILCDDNDEMPPRRKYSRRAKGGRDSFSEVLSAIEEMEANAKKVVKQTGKKKQQKEERSVNSDTDDDLGNEKCENPVRVVFSEDEEAESMSVAINSYGKCVEPDQYPKLQELWQCIVKDMSIEFVKCYFEVIKKMLMGRVSSLKPIASLVADFPKDMLKVHDEFFRLISEMSGVYPYNYHDGSKLISKHFVGGVSEIGAVSLLCCLMHGVMPLDLNQNRPAITRISTIVRTEIKDSLEAAAEENPKQILTRNRVKVPKAQL